MSETKIIDPNVLLRTKLLGLPRESYLVVRVDDNQLCFVLDVPVRTSPPAPGQLVPLTDAQVTNLLKLETINRSR